MILENGSDENDNNDESNLKAALSFECKESDGSLEQEVLDALNKDILKVRE